MQLKTTIQSGGVCMILRGGVEIEAVANGKIAVSHHPYTGDKKAFAHFPITAKVTVDTVEC